MQTLPKPTRDLGEKLTFKIVFEEVRIFGAYFAGWTRVAWVTDAFGPIDAAPMPTAHLFALGTNVDIVDGPRDRLRAGRVKSLVPSETHGPGKHAREAQSYSSEQYILSASGP